jgi:hypothetical protein
MITSVRAAEGQVRTREIMFSDLQLAVLYYYARRRYKLVSDLRDLQQSAVCLPTTVHGAHNP